MKKRILIAAGGTGGHIFPALALAEKLKKKLADVHVELIGGGTKSNIPPNFSLEYKTVDSAPLALSKPLSVFPGLIKNIRGYLQSKAFIKKFRPDLIVGFGSYYSLPVLAAAKSARVPFILHEQNSIPGRVNRLMSKYAAATGVTFPETASLLNGDSVLVDMPLREHPVVARSDAFEYFGLNPNKKTVLVFGGSIGAQKINELCQLLGLHFKEHQLQVIHFSGSSGMTKALRACYEKTGVSFAVKDFETSMFYAWLAADFMIGRAGACTIAEAIEYEVPAILIPYPYAMDNHQEKNADFMVKLGGGKKHVQAKITLDDFAKEVAFFSQCQNLQKMKENIQTFKRTRKTQDLCELIKKFI